MSKKVIIGSLLFSFLLIPFNCIYSFDGERKGFIVEMGIGGGYSAVSSGDAIFENYSKYGLALNMGLGYAPSNRSCLIFAINSNIFLDEVATVWENWKDRMSRDDLGGVGAKIISPFVFAFSPIFRSHSIYGSLEYTHFSREEAPSLLFGGSAGLGILYDKNYEQVFGGIGLSAGAGYEFTQKVAFKCDLVYSAVENNLSGISLLVTLKFYFY